MGTVVPFVLIYLLNWVIFVIIIASLLRRGALSPEKIKAHVYIRRQLMLAIVLSVLFGLSWGVGLLATQSAYKGNQIYIRDIFAAVFVILTSFNGFFIFLMHGVRSEKARNEWKRWFKMVTGKNFDIVFSSSRALQQLHTTKGSKTKETTLSPVRQSTSSDGRSSIDKNGGDEFYLYPDIDTGKFRKLFKKRKTSDEKRNVYIFKTQPTIQETAFETGARSTVIANTSPEKEKNLYKGLLAVPNSSVQRQVVVKNDCYVSIEEEEEKKEKELHGYEQMEEPTEA